MAPIPSLKHFAIDNVFRVLKRTLHANAGVAIAFSVAIGSSSCLVSYLQILRAGVISQPIRYFLGVPGARPKTIKASLPCRTLDSNDLSRHPVAMRLEVVDALDRSGQVCRLVVIKSPRFRSVVEDRLDQGLIILKGSTAM